MAGINQIANLYNVNSKKVSSKLTFQIGEVFSARVIKSNDDSGEIILKLSDGWQFPARLEKPLDFIPEGALKFQIVGSEDGKVTIKLVDSSEQNEASDETALDIILLQNNLSKEEYDILKRMVKHGMPLTKDNIFKIKNLTDFMNKISMNQQEEDIFIEKYISGKGLDKESNNAKNIRDTLKNFFDSLKSINIDDVMLMIENDLEVNTENIDSFKRVFKGNGGVHDSIKDLETKLTKEFKDALTRESVSVDNKGNTADKEHEILNKASNNQNSIRNRNLMALLNTYSSSTVNSENKLTNVIGIIKSFISESNEITAFVKKALINNESVSINTLENINDDIIINAARDILGGKSNENSKVSSKTELDKIMTKVLDLDLLLTEEDSKTLIEIINKKLSDSTEAAVRKNDFVKVENASLNTIKDSIEGKVNEMKNIIRDLISIKNEATPELFAKLSEVIKNNINDFKVFNSLSNQYYYMDMPLKLRENEYSCKIIIKDDRNSGKKIDTKNVKLVVNVKTVNMGTVDCYIKVIDTNMSISLKCMEEWKKVFEIGKEKLVKALTTMGYNILVKVEKKEEEIDITTCREFFDDHNLFNINVEV